MELQPSIQAKRRSRWLGVAIWGLAVGLLYLSLRDISLELTWQMVQSIGWVRIAILFGLNFLILAVMSLRWWLILRSLTSKIFSLLILILYRLAGFGVSFFTPGPQFGGEPVQIDLLHRRKKVPLNAAVSSVYLDRLLDLLANFTFLILGIIVTAVVGTQSDLRVGWLLFPALVILIFPMLHLLALTRGRFPITVFLQKIGVKNRGNFWRRALPVVEQAEKGIANLCQTQPLHLVQWIVLSGSIWVLMIFEYWLTLYFLGVNPTLLQSITAMTAGRIALLAPLPGGLGVLEASQVFSAQRLGWGGQIGLALSLLVRARDFVFALTGMVVVMQAYRASGFSPEKARPED